MRLWLLLAVMLFASVGLIVAANVVGEAWPLFLLWPALGSAVLIARSPEPGASTAPDEPPTS